jgi:Methane/Phenol/Toluene Hydroxylase
MAADAMNVGDLDFGALISSIQTDEARHSQQGEPTIKILVENGKEDVAQKLVDHMFWRSWHIFALLTGLSMDYYTPLEHPPCGGTRTPGCRRPSGSGWRRSTPAGMIRSASTGT